MSLLFACRNQKILERVRYYVGDEVEVIRDAESEFEMIRELENRNYDFALLDYDLAQISGVKLVEELGKKRILPKVLYVIGREAIGAFEFRIRDAEYGDRQIFPVLDFKEALLHLMGNYLRQNAA